MLQQADLSQWQIAPTLHWLGAFGSWLDSKPTQKHKLRSPLTMLRENIED